MSIVVLHNGLFRFSSTFLSLDCSARSSVTRRACRGQNDFQSAHAQHCCQASEAETGRQCQVQPSARRSRPVCSVLKPYSSRVVSSLVASSSNVPMTSEAKHEQSVRYGACTLHSAQAASLVFSRMPGPFGSSRDAKNDTPRARGEVPRKT